MPTNHANPVIFWEINAEDGDTIAEFYRRVFSWKMERDETGFFSVHSSGKTDTPGSSESKTDGGRSGRGATPGINGGIFTGRGQLPTHRALYVEVADVAEVVDRVRDAGGKVMLEPFEGPGGVTLAFFRDPEGHITGVIQR